MESQQTFEIIPEKNLMRSTKQAASGKFVYRSLNNFQYLEEMKKNEQLCDVELVWKKNKIRAHLVILAACSKFFYDKITDKPKQIAMSEFIDFPTMSTVVRFFYKSVVSIGRANVKRLLEAAYKLEAKDLQDSCWNFLLHEMNTANCLDTLQMARKYASNSTCSLVYDYLAEHFAEIAKKEMLQKINHKDLKQIIKRNVSCSAQDRLDLVICWVNYSCEDRKKHFSGLMDHVDLSLLSHEYVKLKIEEEKWLPKKFMERCFKSVKLEKPVPSPITSAKSSKLLVVVGLAFDKITVEAYRFEDKVWLKGLDNEIKYEADNRVAIHGNTVYCFDDGTLKTAVINFDQSETKLVDCETNLERRSWHVACALGNSVYVAGGKHNGSLLSSAESFDVRSGVCRRIANMSEGRDDLGLGALNGLLYVVGGRTATSDFSTSVECYDPRSDSWQVMPPMTVGRHWCGVGVHKDELFVVGGQREWRHCRKEVEAFNPTSRTWRRLPDLIVARICPGVIAVEDKLFVIGGMNFFDGYLDSVEVYDRRSNSWSLMPTPMNTGKALVSAALIDESIVRS